MRGSETLEHAVERAFGHQLRRQLVAAGANLALHDAGLSPEGRGRLPNQLFVAFNSGMTFFDLSQTIRTATSGLIQGPFYFIPLGAKIGYTVEARATMMDVFVSFNFPTFYGFTTRASELNAETWQVTIGFNVYSPVLFKGSAL